MEEPKTTSDELDYFSTPELKALLDQYLTYLGAQIELLDDLCGKFASGDKRAGAKIRGIAHSLSGSGETYGFTAISAPARQVESADDASLPDVVPQLTGAIRSAVASSAASG